MVIAILTNNCDTSPTLTPAAQILDVYKAKLPGIVTHFLSPTEVSW